MDLKLLFNKQLKITLLCIFNLLIIVVLLSLKYIQYSTNDDFYMMAQACGAFGEFSPFLMNSEATNFFYGIILTILFKFFPSINWLSVFTLLFLYMGETVIEAIYVSKYKTWRSFFISMSLSIILIPVLFLGINYAKPAGILSLSSIVLIFHAKNSSQNSKKYIIWSIIIYTISLIIRFQAAIFVLPFSLIFIIDAIRKQLFFNNLKKYFFILSLYLFSTIFIYFSNVFAYSSSNTIKSLNQRELLLVELRDYGIPNYDSHSSEYKSIGLSENDVKMLGSLNFTDSVIFSNETLQKIIDMKHNDETKLSIILHRIIRNLHNDVATEPIFIISVIVVVFLTICTKDYVIILASSVISFSEILYLLYTGRYPLRVLYIPILALIVTSLITCDPIHHINTKIIVLCCIFVSFFSMSKTGILSADYIHGYGYRRLDYDEMIQKIENDNNLYIVESSILITPFSPMESIAYNSWCNIAFDRGWPANTIINYNKTNKMTGNNQNIYEYASKNGNILFITDEQSINMILNYIQDHYNSSASYTLIDCLGGENVYKFSSL